MSTVVVVGTTVLVVSVVVGVTFPVVSGVVTAEDIFSLFVYLR